MRCSILRASGVSGWAESLLEGPARLAVAVGRLVGGGGEDEEARLGARCRAQTTPPPRPRLAGLALQRARIAQARSAFASVGFSNVDARLGELCCGDLCVPVMRGGAAVEGRRLLRQAPGCP